MKQDQFIDTACAAAHEFASASTDSVQAIALEALPSESEAIARMEAEALAAAVAAYKVWLRLRLGRAALEAERRKAQS